MLLWVRREEVSRRRREVFRTHITQFRMTTQPVINTFDVIKNTRPRLRSARVILPVIRSFLSVAKELSIIALSQQFPRRLMLHAMFSSRNNFWNAPLEYWLPRSE